MKPSTRSHVLWWNFGWGALFLLFAAGTYGLELLSKQSLADADAGLVVMIEDIKKNNDIERLRSSGIWCMRQLREWNRGAERWWPSDLVQMMCLAAAVLFLSGLFVRNMHEHPIQPGA